MWLCSLHCGNDKVLSNYFIGVFVYFGKKTAEDAKERAALLLTSWKEIIFYLLRITRPAQSSSLPKQNKVRNIFLHILNNLYSAYSVSLKASIILFLWLLRETQFVFSFRKLVCQPAVSLMMYLISYVRGRTIQF